MTRLMMAVALVLLLAGGVTIVGPVSVGWADEGGDLYPPDSIDENRF